jgi:hypothetical protein
LIKITRKHPSAGNKKIRGGAVACGLAVRVLLIFLVLFDQVENPDLSGQKEQKDQWYAEKNENRGTNRN